MEKSFYSSPETAIYRRKRGIADWAAVANKHNLYHRSKPPYFAVICAVLGAFPGLLPIWQKVAKMAKSGKILQTADTVISKIVVKIGVFYY